jgi:tetratricopeptide (TPR) repeat protein
MLFALSTLYVQGATGAMAFGSELPLWARLFNALNSYLVYLQQLFWPTGLAAFYPFDTEAITLSRALVCAALLGAISLGVLLWSRSRPYAMMGWLWFIGTLVPVIGVVQVGTQAHADRYMYLPLIGIAIAVAFAAQEAVARSPAMSKSLGVAAVGIVLALSVIASAQVRTWKDSFSLFEHALSVSPEAAFPHVRLGMIYAMNVKFKKAQEHFDLAFERDAEQAAVVLQQLDSMAAAHVGMGRFPEAIRTAEFAILLAVQVGDGARAHAIGERLSRYRAR